MSPHILFRPGNHDEVEEMAKAKDYFPVSRQRTSIPPGSLVFCRYSALPFYHELEVDVRQLGSKLANSYEAHQYVANFDYYDDLADVTFPTWFRLQDVPFSERNTPFVVKGRTNSRKTEWSRKMYAPDFKAAVQIGAELMTDGLIGQQGLVVRKFVPLETFELSIVGMPITNEWRVFYYNGQRLAFGYYWGCISDWAFVEKATPEFLENGLPFADSIAQRVKDIVPFVVIDVARTQEGKWMVVELNDGNQSGLNGVIEPDALYRNLFEAVSRNV